MFKLGRRFVLEEEEMGLLLEPWYHDFSPLGIATPQRGGIYPENQESKQAELFRMIDAALELAGGQGVERSVLECFCADGFYGIYAARQGASGVVGVDLDEREVGRARLMARLLDVHRRTEFRVQDVFDVAEPASITICAGGLYHLEDPARLLRRLRELTTSALVVQTVFHLGRRDDADYFETPAPGWTWGCRFSVPYLHDMIERAGWAISAHEENELIGNHRPEDRGSAYLLCVPS